MMAAQILDIRAELEKRRAISELNEKASMIVHRIRSEVKNNPKVLTEKIREESRRIREAKRKEEGAT